MIKGLLELVTKSFWVLILALYYAIMIPCFALSSWLWPQRERIDNRPLRWGYIALVIPFVGVAYYSKHFEDFFEKIGKM